MIIDQETNFLYLSDKLQEDRYSDFLTEFKIQLNKHNVKFEFLDDTNDIWCRDYMPIQVKNNLFVDFRYDPDYLEGFESLKTVGRIVCQNIGIIPEISRINLDGGNVIKSKDKVIITDNIFKENELFFSKEEIISNLQEKFDINEIIIVPHLPYDVTGHSDGIVRFYDENTVLVNDYSKTRQSASWQSAFKRALKNHNLNTIEIPYLEIEKKNSEGFPPAIGCYMNFLQIGDTVFVPTFNIPDDEKAVKQFENDLFKGKNVVAINSEKIAERGGVLNCISWTIKA